MKDLLADLIALQNVELEMFKAEDGLKEIPKEIEEIESIIQARKRSLDSIEEEIDAFEEKKVPLEAELKENQAILDVADSRIKRIKTNKEYLALQREIDLAKKRKSDIEEQLLALMDKVEKKNVEKQRIQQSFEADKAILDEKKKKLISQIKDLETILKGYKGQDDSLRKTVAPTLLSRYDRIKQNKKGLVVVECLGGVCKGCHMHIPPQLYNDLVRGDKMITCPVCQRILYTQTKTEET